MVDVAGCDTRVAAFGGMNFALGGSYVHVDFQVYIFSFVRRGGWVAGIGEANVLFVLRRGM